MSHRRKHLIQAWERRAARRAEGLPRDPSRRNGAWDRAPRQRESFPCLSDCEAVFRHQWQQALHVRLGACLGPAEAQAVSA